MGNKVCFAAFKFVFSPIYTLGDKYRKFKVE